ncbi:MAG: roadblock/LC7 domain-containing protein, partial [Methanobacteriaceae archaeon]|nr:roadblock/LC7 domain-containing protein [Methanobacteriaceae archaeon]
CSTIMGAAEAASGQMNTGAVDEITVRTEKGIIILKPAGEKAILTALAEPEAQLGLLLVEMETRAGQVEEILKEM